MTTLASVVVPCCVFVVLATQKWSLTSTYVASIMKCGKSAHGFRDTAMTSTFAGTGRSRPVWLVAPSGRELHREGRFCGANVAHDGLDGDSNGSMVGYLQRRRRSGRATVSPCSKRSMPSARTVVEVRRGSASKRLWAAPNVHGTLSFQDTNRTRPPGHGR
jgi:hypothetical protein